MRKFLCFILLSASLFSCSHKKEKLIQPNQDFFTPPKETPKDLFFDYRCTDCHRMRGKLVGPSLLEISKRYKADKDAKPVLLHSILLGCSGKYADDYKNWPMPPQKIPKKKAEEIVDWILSLSR